MTLRARVQLQRGGSADQKEREKVAAPTIASGVIVEGAAIEEEEDTEPEQKEV